MKTEDLIAMLSTNVEPVDRWQVLRTVGIAVLIGGAAAFVAVFLALGVRPSLEEAGWVYLPLKLVFTLQIVVLTSLCLTKFVRPGSEKTTPVALAALPFVVVIILAALSLAAAPRAHWDELIIGNRWLECLVLIPVIAIVPFAAVIWAVRQMAPTDLTRTGALAGLVAGGISATAYALHCTDDSLPFIALWYGGTVAICALAGATLGPRLLRW
jgi:hypothetical protein